MPQKHALPLVEDLFVGLNGARFITKLDLTSGYNQVELELASRYIKTFATHMGLYQYKRLKLGINTASFIFQKAIGELLAGIEGAMDFSDDIIVFAADKETHDERVAQVFQRLDTAGLTVNCKKCEFAKSDIEFFGFRFSSTGISIQDSKLSALKNASSPKKPSELRSLLGLANYCSMFIQNMADIVLPLRKLTHNNVSWEWTAVHEQAVQRLKDALTGRAVHYFDKSWRTVLTVDASVVGLGAVLSQTNPNNPKEKHVILYASKALSPVERRYSQVEKEALAVVWACEKLQIYLLGREFDVVTDNQAVKRIFNNPTTKPKA